jgi:hypothetical protein
MCVELVAASVAGDFHRSIRTSELAERRGYGT